MLVVWITVAIVVLCAVGVMVYARTGEPQVNGLVWKEIGKDVYRTINLKTEAKNVIKWYAGDVAIDEKYPSEWNKPDINITASRHVTMIPADLHNDFFDEIQKLLDERGREEKITLRAYLYPLESGNVLTKSPHIHTLKLHYSSGWPNGNREVGYYCTLCDSRFLYTNKESTPEEVVETEDNNRKAIKGMCDLLDWTYGEGKYAEKPENDVQVDKTEKKG